MMMKDKFGRNIDYVRLSLTDRCQLRCHYCMPETGVKWLKPCQQLTGDEIKEIVHVLAKLGVKKLKLTGGEPLLYKGLVPLIGELKKIQGIEEVTLTTNGIKLPEMIDDLVKAGLDAVNISMDTLDPKRYAEITRIGKLDATLKGLDAAVKSGVRKVNVNSVLTESFTKQDLLALVNLAKETRVNVRFIEWMPIGNNSLVTSLSVEEMKQILMTTYGEVKNFSQPLGNGPARYYEIEGFKGKIGFISAVSDHFCNTCNRVRITSDGFLKTCLAFNHGADLKQALKDNALEAEILTALKLKPKKHLFGEDFENRELKNMGQIGG